MAITIAQLVAKVSSSGVSMVQGELQGLGAESDKTGLSLKNLAFGGAAIGAAALVALGVASTVMAGNFQAGVTSLETGAGEIHKNLGMVSDGMLKMAVDTGTSTSQLTAGMYMIESAGFHGADGLNVLKAAAEGAKVGQADLGVVADATTTIMTDYPHVMNGASGAVNTLITTVANGKTHMSDLAASLSQILPTASAAGVGLNDVMGAMSTMTGEGVPAADAATYLRQTLIALSAPSKQTVDALASVGLKSSDVAAEMQKSLPGALQMITDAVGNKFPVGSAAYVNAMKDISGGSKQMQGMLDLTGDHLKTFQGNVQTIGGVVTGAGSKIQGWGQVQQDFNFKMDRAKEVVETLMISIGTHLLPVAGDIADVFATKVVPGAEAVATTLGNLMNFITSHEPVLDALKALFIGIAVSMTVSAIPAIIASVVAFGAQAVAAGAAAVAVIAATWPFIALAAAVAAVIFVIIQIVSHWNTISSVARGVVGPAISWLHDRFIDLQAGIQIVVTAVKDVINWFGQMATAAEHALNSAKNTVNNIPVIGGIANFAGFAEGTDSAPGGVAMVGERGPEMVYLPRGSKVIPNNQLGTQATPVQGGGGGPVILQLDGRTLATAFMPYIANAIRYNVGTHA